MGTIPILVLSQDDDLYDQILGAAWRDPDLLHWMWQDAESRPNEHPDKIWWVAVIDDQAAAWTAALIEDGTVYCRNSYHRRGYRHLDLYPLVYAARHAWLVSTGLPGKTYVYEQPLPLHTADGWEVTADDWSREPDTEPHHWYELEWKPQK